MNSNNRKYLFFISQNYSFPILRPLQNEILARGDEVKWFLYGSEINHAYLQEDEDKLECVHDIISYQPDAVFVPGNVVPSFIPGLKVQVFHGLPGTKTKHNGQIYHYIIRGMFDLYCTQGPESTEKFRELQEKHRFFSVVETGWCKLDPLFYNNNVEEQSSLPTIFFASTFSPRFSKSKVLYPLLLSMMKKHNIQWYITLHPKMDKEITELYQAIDLPNVKFVETTDLINYFKKSDLMLCDTSSIVYEFLTQLKPVITFQTEKDESHLINVEDINKLEDTILTTLKQPDTNLENIKKSVTLFHPYTDGHSSHRILSAVDEMLSGNNLPPKKKPLNLLRNYRLRKQLNYWKW